MSDQLNIEVVYALPQQQTVIALRVAPETCVLAAIEQSGIVQKHPEIDLSVNKFGIYSRPVKGCDLLQDGDRIEIYRPLIADPREMRKKRAEKAKEEGRADAVTGGRPDVHRKHRE
ncbi:RnfH family protein [Aeromonas veronii]|uniref:RnfH family protein n=1 Tax=Aeromonas veronii TaxID=654 RepID=UPI003D1B271C